jgi:hypothetical protein
MVYFLDVLDDSDIPVADIVAIATFDWRVSKGNIEPIRRCGCEPCRTGAY